MSIRGNRIVACVSAILCLASTTANAQVSQSTTNSQPSSRIVGGEVVVSDTPGTLVYPWMTPLLFTPGGVFDPSNPIQFCGGTFLGPNHVLTAAHCINNAAFNNPESISVGVGFQSLSGDAASAQVIPVSQIIIHPSGQVGSIETADIAILVLSEPANLDNFITFNQVEIQPGTVATVIGWGTLFSGGPSSDDLREVTVPVVPLDQCEANLAGFLPAVDATMLCAGLAEGGQDACQGDSGGPLFITDGQNRPVQIGVVSWGIGCALPGLPGVYADVAALADFIFRAVTASAPSVGGLAFSALNPNQMQVAQTLDVFAASLLPGFNITDLVRVYTDIVLSSTAQRRLALESLMPQASFAQVNLARQTQAVTGYQISARSRTLRSASNLNPIDTSQLNVRTPQSSNLSSTRIQSSPSWEEMTSTERSTAASLNQPELKQGDEVDNVIGQTGIPRIGDESRRWNAFLAGDILFGDSSLDAISNSDANINNYLIMGGVDYAIAPNFFLGGALGYSSGNQRNMLFRSDADSVIFTAYGTTEYGTGGYTTGYISYGFDSYNTRRSIMLPSETRTAVGSNGGSQFGVGIETGWMFNVGAIQIDPLLSLRHNTVRLDGYTETGAGDVSLQVDGRSSSSTLANLGVNFAYPIPFEQNLLVPFIGLGLNHELGSASQSVTSSFVGGGSPFTVNSGDFDRTWLNLSAGLNAQLGNDMTARLLYRTDVGRSDASIRNLSAGISYSF
ncbi:MAG: autotransporter domain-containing protein [Leptolyngbya sp. DLM2.Bin27]|nr:MAG: autotransporter domain-containing protein [Leptolyngbya sp. DLM2.Bin27]